MVDWWTDNDEVEYNKRKMCLVDQYSNFTVPGTDGMKVYNLRFAKPVLEGVDGSLHFTLPSMNRLN